MRALFKILFTSILISTSFSNYAGPVYNCGEIPATTSPDSGFCQCLNVFAKDVCYAKDLGSCSDGWIRSMFSQFGRTRFNQLCRQYPDIIPAGKTATDCTNQMLYLKENCLSN